MNISFNIIGKGEPIIFIHGIGSRKISWNGIIKELKEKYLCISYDLRGHGESKVVQNTFYLNDLVEDLEKLRSYLKIQKMHLVGHSLGGMIAPSYAIRYRERVASIALLSTAAFRKVEDEQKILNIISKIKGEGIDKVLPDLISRWFTDEFINNNQNIINKRLKQVKSTPLNIFLNVFQIYASTKMDTWLKKIKVPSLVMTGENDLGCSPQINKKIAKALNNSKLIILNNLKHAIVLEDPQLVATNLKMFLKSVKYISNFD